MWQKDCEEWQEDCKLWQESYGMWQGYQKEAQGGLLAPGAPEWGARQSSIPLSS